MNQQQVIDAIDLALDHLYRVDTHKYEQWVIELYNFNDEPIEANWNSDNLKRIETDLMGQTVSIPF